MSAGIEISGLVVRRGQLTILEQLNLVIPLGKVVAVVGRPGSGKSALLNAILGRAATPAGSVRICGMDARESTVSRRLVTWIDQCGVLESQWTVYQNVEFSLRLAGLPTPARDEVHRALRESDLPDRTFDRRAHALTPFETFATCVAIARLRRTPAILLDEPNATLGPIDVKRIAAVIRELCGADKAVLIVTRDLSFADDASDIVHLLDEGRLSNGRVSRRHNTPRAIVDQDLSFRAGPDTR